MDLSIKNIQTSKDDIDQPDLAKDENMYIAPLGSSILICGKSGSGKSTLLSNFLMDDRFYKGYFKKTFLFSPTANGDDVQKSLKIAKKHVCTKLEDAPEWLETILRCQSKKLDGGGKAGKVDQYCIIFDDVIGDIKFMNSKEFTQCFYQVRHVNATTFICSQHFNRIPRVCRLQANFIHYFACSQSEVETLCEEFCPPNMPKKEFMSMVADVTEEPFSFLTINMKKPWPIRFRQNLGQIISLDHLRMSVGRGKQEEDKDVGLGEDEQEGRGSLKRERAGEGADGQRGGLGATTGAKGGGQRDKVQKTSQGGQQGLHNKDRHPAAPSYPGAKFVSRTNTYHGAR